MVHISTSNIFIEEQYISALRDSVINTAKGLILDKILVNEPDVFVLNAKNTPDI